MLPTSNSMVTLLGSRAKGQMRVALIVVYGAVHQAVGAQVLEAGNLIVEPPRRPRRRRTRRRRTRGEHAVRRRVQVRARKPSNSSSATGSSSCPASRGSACGSVTMARAIATRYRSPLESWRGRRSRRRSMLTFARRLPHPPDAVGTSPVRL